MIVFVVGDVYLVVTEVLLILLKLCVTSDLNEAVLICVLGLLDVLWGEFLDTVQWGGVGY